MLSKKMGMRYPSVGVVGAGDSTPSGIKKAFVLKRRLDLNE